MASPKGPLKRKHRLAVAVGSTVLALIVIEGLLHLFPPPISDRLFQTDARFGRFHIPGRQGYQRSPEFVVSVKINSQGLRDTEHTVEKPTGVYRVLILGDSFAEGMQVPLEDTVGKQLEQLLNARGGPPYEVVNAGVAGFGTDTELLFYRSLGRLYHPDLVLLFFFRNDLADNGDFRYFKLEDGVLKTVETRSAGQDSRPMAAIRGWLWDHFMLIRLLGNAWNEAQGVASAAGSSQSPEIDPAFRVPMSGEVEGQWSLTTALLEEIDREVRADDAHLVLVGIPDVHSVESQRPQPGFDMGQVNRHLGEVAASAGIAYIDLLPGFSSQYESTRAALYWPVDEHWNSAGHQLAAQIVFDSLVRNGWLLP